MIKKIQVDGFANIPDQILEIPARGIRLGRESSYDDWYDFPERFKIVSTVQEIYDELSRNILIKESQETNDICNLEFHFDISGETYKYFLSLLEGRIITESLSIDSKVVYCRIQDDSEFIVNKEIMSEKDYNTYKFLRGCDTIMPFLNYLDIGKPVRDNIKGIIIYDNLAWKSYNTFVEDLKKEYGNDVRSYLTSALSRYGFDSGNLRYDPIKGFINTLRGKEYQIEFYQLGSGVQQFCYVYPLLVEAKKTGNLFVCDFLDCHLHTLVSRELQEEFKDVQMITRISHSEVSI